MAKKTSAYGIQRPLEDVFPVPIVSARAPTTSDKNFEIGQLWIYTTTGQIYGLANVASGSATWSALGPGASDVDTLTADSGGAISPTAGTIILAGGTNITSVGTAGPGTITFNLDAAITLATSVSSPIYTVAAATDLNINAATGQDIIMKMGDAAGANKVSFVDSASVEVAAIDSNGGWTFGSITFTGLLTASASATIETAGTALNLGSDNSGDAVNLGVGTVARAINVGTSAAAHVISIGNAAAGAITLDTAAGISLDSATASNFTVTGASADLTLGATGGSINITATEAAADAVVITASDGAGGVQIKAGTGGILIGNEADTTTIDVGDIAPTAARTITIGGGTVVTASVTDTIDIGPDGATTNADSVKTVNVNGGGVTTGQVLTNIATGAITSGTHTVSIQSGNAAAGTVATNVSTGTGTKTVNFGNADGLTTVNIDAITLINDSINVNTSINTGTSTGAVSIGNAAAGALAMDTAAGISLDGATASNFTVTGAADLTLNSTAGSVNIDGGEADPAAISIQASDAAGGIDVDFGTGGLAIDGTGGAYVITSDTASSLGVTGGGIDLTLDSAAGRNVITGGEAAADAVRIQADDAAGGIDIDSGTGGITLDSTGAFSIDGATASNVTVTGAAADLTLGATGGSINITATEAAADAVVITASDAAGGIDLTTGGGSIDLSSSGLVSVVADTSSTASPTAAATMNVRVGTATFTGFTTAAAGAQQFTITNSFIGTSSSILVTACNEGGNDAQMTITRVNRASGSMVVTLTNNGAAALNGNVAITFWVLSN